MESKVTSPLTLITEFELNNESFNKDQLKLSKIDHIEGGIVIDNVLSAEECQLIIQKMFIEESEAASTLTKTPVLWRGWSDDQQSEYKKLGIRVIRTSEQFAATLTERIASFLPRVQTTFSPSLQKTVEHTLQGLSHRHRFIRYDALQSFPVHMDGPYIHNDQEKSFLTCLFFLNSNGADYQGGELSFVDANETPIGSGASNNYETKTITTIQPMSGKCIIFPHKILHTSSPITNGQKFLIRNDIMYKST